jgi:hypothetical protein
MSTTVIKNGTIVVGDNDCEAGVRSMAARVKRQCFF